MRVSDAIGIYLRWKRASGLSFKTEEFTLRQCQNHLGDPLISEVTSEQILEFLNARRASSNTRTGKHCCLRMFFEFLADRGHMSALVMPSPPRRDDGPEPMPFVYKRTEIRTLIQATHGNQTHGLCEVGEVTFRSVLLSLYATGAMTGEIFWLKLDDLDLRRRTIFLRGDRVVLARRVPVGADLHKLLVDYLRCEERLSVSGPHLFVSRHGGPLKADTMVNSFARLRRRAGIGRVDGSLRQPRMRDLRQTFAVHRIASWIKEGADLNRMLPALSAYMGLTDFVAAQRFLRITPERFKRGLDALSPFKTRGHWRDDPKLLKYLASI